ncbi:MAG: glycosyl hydrolase family 2 [Ignavibacteriales bacterium]|nr:MAG: glycosyl hydrolase family 2 [Ignavibacteriales bacterium]
MKKLLLFLVSLSIISFAKQGDKKIEMPSIFSDNMVLQQKTNAPFWGIAIPGTDIKIKAGWGASVKTKVKEDGNWIIEIKTPKAGGPYNIELTVGDSIINYKNILIGEVWLCSGQSNMEMPLQGWPPNDTIATSKQEIPNAANNKMRFFTVTRAFATEPEFNCTGTWSECNSETAAMFSATAYFFGKKLYNELKIPIGLIHSSWGGTPIEAWTNGKYLEEVEEYNSIVSKIAASIIPLRQLNEWLASRPQIDINNLNGENKWKNLKFEDSDCSSPNFNDVNWKEMNLPILWENTDLGNFDGAVWFRKKIEIPTGWLNKELVIELGPIDDMDETYVNGQKVGGFETEGYWQALRVYNVPANLVKDSILYVAVRVIDNQGGGGIYGAAEKMKLSLSGTQESISLAGNWKYLPVAEYKAGRFFVFGSDEEVNKSRPVLPVTISAYTPTTLYNAMIHPLIPFAIKGAIWYQGEANTGNPGLYTTLMEKMIKDWREEFKRKDFPFYYVQIAPYEYGMQTPSQKLREAQLKALSIPKTGMAVTMDIGNPLNIHPANKKDVGGRLALWALAKDYGKKVFYTGPVYKSMKVNKDKAVLSFSNADGGLIIKELNGSNNFIIAGEDKIFKKADVKVEGKKLIISNPEITKPAAVRYCWSNIEEGTFFNGKGLPSSSFRTDEWID